MSNEIVAGKFAGPWSIADWGTCDNDGALEKCGSHVVDAYGKSVQTITEEGSTEQEEAIIHLIAAAPYLLAACQRALYLLKGREHDQFLRDAISKALGEQA